MISCRLPLLVTFCVALCALATPPAHAQRSLMSCTMMADAKVQLEQLYGPRKTPFAASELAEDAPAWSPETRLDQGLLDMALASYQYHHCRGAGGRNWGPAQIVIIDFAKPSTQPRLYAINLLTGDGIDTPVQVAHGIGSDPDDDGVATYFSNVRDSLSSSLGAARGAELYNGINGPSLRLDGLDFSNSAMRARDIVAHSYPAAQRRYFNFSLLTDRQGKPGTSEGCIVVAPHLREWLFDLLKNGGFLYSGLSGPQTITPSPAAP